MTNASLTRLPGNARPRAEILREYEQANSARRAGVPAVLWDFFAPGPEKIHAWRVQLSCGHIRESLTEGKEYLLSGGRRRMYSHAVPYHWETLPDGCMACEEFDCWYPDQPYRDIAEWKKQEIRSHPANPEEPPDDLEPAAWARCRHAEPWDFAVWEVVLSCGHAATTTVSDTGWKPEDGIYRDLHPGPEKLKRRQELLAYPDIGEEMKRRILDNWPVPVPWEQCSTCACIREIVAFEDDGPLVPPPPGPRKPPDPRAVLKRRIREAEAETKRLQAQLAALGRQEEKT